MRSLGKDPYSLRTDAFSLRTDAYSQGTSKFQLGTSKRDITFKESLRGLSEQDKAKKVVEREKERVRAQINRENGKKRKKEEEEEEAGMEKETKKQK